MNPKRSMQSDRSIELFPVNDNDPPPRLQSAISFWWPLLDDPSAASGDRWAREVIVHPDCEGGSHWMVDWGDSDGGCYVTTFDGPMAEQRALEYFDALKSGALKMRQVIE